MIDTIRMSQNPNGLEEGNKHLRPEAHSDQVVLEEDPKALRSKTETLLILSGLFGALFLAALDFTIVSPALPTISHDLNSASGYTWIGSSYLLANAATAPIWGNFSDIWGRKPILLIAVAVFGLGSLVCALAVDIAMLIVGRAIQGSAAGGIVILVNVCISDLFSIRKRGFFLGLTGLIWAFASGLGPVLGGSFAQNLSWSWIWWINLPVCGLAFVVLLAFIRLDTSTALFPRLHTIDWLGSVSIIGVLVMFLLGLNFGGETFPWSSPKVICLVVFGVGMIGVFIFAEAKISKCPIMPLRLFQDQSNLAAFLVTFCHGFTYISASYFLPIYFQAVGQKSPIISGLLILPLAVVQSMSGIAAGYYMNRTGRYLDLIRAGMALVALGFGLFIDLDRHFSIGRCCAFEVVAGVGIGLVFTSPLIALQKNTGKSMIATTTATFGFVRNVATALSVVLGGVVFQHSMDEQQDTLVQVMNADLANEFAGVQAEAHVLLISTLSLPQKMVARAAYATSLKHLRILYTATATLGLCGSMFISQVHLASEVDASNSQGTVELDSNMECPFPNSALL